MDKLSVIEFEELGKAIGASIKEQLTGLVSEADIKKMIETEAREIIKKSATRTVPWADPISPQDFYTLEKALNTPAGSNAEIQALHDYNDELYVLYQLAKFQGRPIHTFNSYSSYQSRFSELAKALNTATAGSGAEWLPTGYSQTVIEQVELEAVVASKFPSITMPTNPYTYPIKLTDGTAYLGGEATTDSPSMYRTSTMGTSDLTFTAVKLVANYPVSDELQEESIVPALPTMRISIAKAMAKAEDNAIINGDDTTIHRDTGYTVASDDARRAWNGLRDLVITSGENDCFSDGSSWSTSAGLGIFRAAYEPMGIYSTNTDDLICLCNTKMYNKFRSLDQVSTNDKFGTAATIHNGKLTHIDGIEIVKTQHVEENQNNAGVYDGTTTTDTQFLIANTKCFWRGIRRKFTVEFVHKPLYGMDYLVATTRRIWKPIYDATENPICAWCYNITK